MKVIAVLAALAACGSKGPPGPPGPQGSNAPDAGPVPSSAPAGIAFQDTDPRHGFLGGTVVVAHAADETNVTSYTLYFGSDATTKLYLSPIVVMAKTGADVNYTFATGSPVPFGATHLLAYAANAGGEDATPVAVSPIDNFPVVHDLSMGAPSGTFNGVIGARLDATSQKLVVFTQTVATGHATILRCDLDATNCTAVDLGSAGFPFGVLDTVNNKLDAFFGLATGPFAATAFAICNVDGTGCAAHALNFGALTVNSVLGNPVVDAANLRVMIPFDAIDGGGIDHLFVMRVALDGSASAATEIAALPGANVVFSRTETTIDPTNAKLYALATTFTPANGASAIALFQCDLDATNCVEPWLPSGAWQFPAEQTPATTGSGVGFIVDSASSRALAFTGTANGALIAVVHCDLGFGARSCITSDPSDGVGWAPASFVIDANNSKLFASALDLHLDVTRHARCELDGTGCTLIPTPLRLTTQLVDDTSQRLVGFGFANRKPQAVTLHTW
jgi:hypothetical protein